MRLWLIPCLLCLLLVPALAVFAPVAAAPHAYPAVPAPEWDALFDRRSGWTGADGIYSIPLSGDERPGSAGGTTTFWTFSDTFIGTVDDANHRVSGSLLVNNTMALLNGAAPDPAAMQFFWGADAGGVPRARVIPNTSAEHWFWPNDGIVLNGKLYLYSLRMKPGRRATGGFAIEGVSLLNAPATSPSPFQTYTQVSTPLFVAGGRRGGEVIYGQAIMPRTSAAGAPNPDGYLYVYGLRNDPLDKKLLVARVLPEHIERFSEYRYWDGAGWSTSINAAAPVTSRLSSEFSVTPLADGRFILVFQLDTLSSSVAVRYGSSPTGPWTEPTIIWNCPEDTLTPNTYTYNAKAHPHLSRPGELLISYNVNTTDFAEHFANADIYRPRFIRLPLN